MVRVADEAKKKALESRPSMGVCRGTAKSASSSGRARKKAHLPQVAIEYRSDVDGRETLLASPLEVLALPELKSAG